MMATKDLDTAEKLAEYVRPFVGSTGGGQYSFQLLCKRCNRQDSVSSSRIKMSKPNAKYNVARSLIEQGWTFSDYPLCPNCSKPH
jgi:hypothetical protein